MNADGLPGIRRAPQPLPVEVEYVLAPARVLRRPPKGEGWRCEPVMQTKRTTNTEKGFRPAGGRLNPAGKAC